MTARKQPGRRYGPPPSSSPHPEMQAPAPMTKGRRVEVYTRDGAPFTPQQERQFYRAAVRFGATPYGGKGHPTPKQKKVRRDG